MERCAHADTARARPPRPGLFDPNLTSFDWFLTKIDARARYGKGYALYDGGRVNGNATLGENIADEVRAPTKQNDC